MASIWQDIRFGLRMLRHGKGVTAVAVISLALAIAGNTAVFGLVNALLYRPLPYPQADRLVLFGLDFFGRFGLPTEARKPLIQPTFRFALRWATFA